MAIIDKYKKKSAVIHFRKKDIGVTSCLNSTRTFYSTVRNINI